ncbi:hypothetical protein DI392_12300 [Vibrio albus]|uniref:Uncharacterized protein n=1 Tax=Vibrio albus TaxID=2200953 RepID=A0A2U3B8G8_9VIBR|nr:hypothetical protein DI392_12300 [Vibrio albus]
MVIDTPVFPILFANKRPAGRVINSDVSFLETFQVMTALLSAVYLFTVQVTTYLSLYYSR